MNHHHRVGQVGCHHIRVVYVFLCRAVYVHQTHGLGQVWAHLGHHHGHAHHALLLVVDLLDGLAEVGGGSLTQTGLGTAIDELHGHTGQRVFSGEVLLELLDGPGLHDGQGVAVQARGAAHADDTVACRVEHLPGHIVAGGPAQGHAVVVGTLDEQDAIGGRTALDALDRIQTGSVGQNRIDGGRIEILYNLRLLGSHLVGVGGWEVGLVAAKGYLVLCHACRGGHEETTQQQQAECFRYVHGR